MHVDRPAIRQLVTSMAPMISLAASCWLSLPTAAGNPLEGSLLAPAPSDENVATGWPRNYWPWARTQKAWNYTGYYVGGGDPIHLGRGRCSTEGTWGWDYSGACFSRRVQLGWWSRPKLQGGTGRYEPDGPRILEQLSEH